MNIKLKALLIAASSFIGFFGALFMIVKYPAVLFFVTLAGLFYAVYRLTLNILEAKETRGPQ